MACVCSSLDIYGNSSDICHQIYRICVVLSSADATGNAKDKYQQRGEWQVEEAAGWVKEIFYQKQKTREP